VEEVTMCVVMDREDYDDYEEFTFDDDDEPVDPSDIDDMLKDDNDDENDEDKWREVGQLNVKLNESLDLSDYTTFGEKVQMQVAVRDRKARLTTLRDPRARSGHASRAAARIQRCESALRASPHARKSTTATANARRTGSGTATRAARARRINQLR
jgi:hypothetical protein